MTSELRLPPPRGKTRVCTDCGADKVLSASPYCPECRTSATVCPCGDVFIATRDRKYCSPACNLRRFQDDPTHQRQAGRRGGGVRGAQRHANRTTDWYLKENGQHVHRTVAAAVLGRPLRKGEVVHHEDQNKLNNLPENLIVFSSQAVHAHHHKMQHCGTPCDCACIRLAEEVMPR